MRSKSAGQTKMGGVFYT